MPSLVGTKRLDWLRSQREAAVAEVESLAERAVAEDRDLTDDEHAAATRRREAVEKLDREIGVEVDTVERQASYDELAGRIEPALRSRSVGNSVQVHEPEVAYRSAGEYVADVLRSAREQDRDATERLTAYRSTLSRANQTTASTPGLLPQPILGPVVTDIDARRPAIDAATKRPMPASGKLFLRPTVAQHVQVGKQAAEKTALPSREMVVNDLQVTKQTFGGSVNLSFQDRDWTDPAILNLLISDLAAAYAVETSDYFTTTLVGAVTQSVNAGTGATPSTTSASWLTAIYQAAGMVFAGGNAVPNTLWVAPDVWAQLGSLVDGSGRPMFPMAGPMNSMGALDPGMQGGNVGGFRTVVDATFPPGTSILGDSIGVEFFEQIGGTISAIEPSILGTSLAFFGYVATVVVRPKLFVSIES